MKPTTIRVLVIVNAVFGYDGISNVATNYYRYQDKSRIAMDLLTINPVNEKLAQEFQRNGNRLYTLEGRNRNPLRYLIRLRSIIKENSYNIVHVHGNSATMSIELFAAKLANCPVRIAHSHNTRCDHPILNAMLMPLFSRCYTHCCACSPEAGRFLFGNRSCHIVNNGVCFQKYCFNPEIRNRLRKKYGVEDQFVLGHIGRFAPQKNHSFLLHVFASVLRKTPNSVLLLVGEGELLPEIRKQACEMGIEKRVIFYGTTDKINEVVQMMDSFVFPSINEGLGIVAIEAQAAGVPCVVSTEVPVKVKVLDEVVFLPLEAGYDHWADAILLSRVSEQQRIASATVVQQKMIEAHFDISDNCREMAEYYSEILEGAVRS